MNSFVRRLLPTHNESIDLIVMMMLMVAALTAFRSSYGGSRFLVVGVVMAAAGALVAHLGHKFKFPLVVASVAALVVYALLGAAVALPNRSLGGVLLSPDSVLAALTTAVTGWKELVTTAPPVGGTGDLMAIPAFAGIVGGFTGVALARRFRSAAPAITAPLVVLGLAIATGTNEPVSILINGAVFGGVSIAWMAWREHHRRPLLGGSSLPRRQIAAALLMLLIAGAGGYYVAGGMPFDGHSGRDIWRQTVTPPFDPRIYPSPLSSYRQYVKASNGPGQVDPVMFTVSGLPANIPVRIATMDTYDGLVWQVSSGDPTAPSLNDSGSFERIGTSLPPEYPGEIATVEVTIGSYSDVWIPDVGEVISLEFKGSSGGSERDRQLSESFRYNRSTDTAASRLRLREGDRYVMKVRLPEDLAKLSDEEIIPSVNRLGPTVSVAAITQKLVDPTILAVNDTGQRLDMVRDSMTKWGTYSDGDTGGGQIRALAGHSAFRLTSFVQGYPRVPLIGDAEQYAATYALLFRDLDRIPTRVVMGFMPSASSIESPVDVHATEVEAWVEVPVAGRGWLAIYPTPQRDQTSIMSSSPRQPEPDYRTQNPPPPPLVDPEFDRPATVAGKAKTPDEPVDEKTIDDVATPAVAIVSGRLAVVAGTGAGVLALIVLGVFIIVLIKIRRRRRRRRRGSGHERIANGWKELLDFAVDTGRPVPIATTRREAAHFVGSDTMVLADRADAAVWGGGEPDDEAVDLYWRDLIDELRSMRSSLNVLERLKTKFSFRSIRSQRTRRRKARNDSR